MIPYEMISKILDGDGILITGAGASFGAINLLGNNFPDSRTLAKNLYEECGDGAADDDLSFAASKYLKSHSPQELISFLQLRLGVKEVKDWHKVLFTLPWRRCYTTNYDNVGILASANQEGQTIVPVTISNPPQLMKQGHRQQVFINGYLGNLTEKTLENEFKLCTNSYLNTETILNNPWGEILHDDCDTSEVIVIVGLSLKYDLDLARIIFNTNKNKVIQITGPSITQIEKEKLEIYGQVFSIGIEGFANEISSARNSYTGRCPNTSLSLRCFEKKDFVQTSKSASMGERFSFLFNGDYCDSLFSKTQEDGKFDAIVYRKKINDIKDSFITGNKKCCFIHSDLGNGKTTAVQILQRELFESRFDIYEFKNAYEAYYVHDIKQICESSQKSVVIVEDYFNFTNLIDVFSRYNTSNVCFIFTARSGIWGSRYETVITRLGIHAEKISCKDINKLDDYELDDCVKVIDNAAFWGVFSKLSQDEKKLKLKLCCNGNSRFQSIILFLIENSSTEKKFATEIKRLELENQNFYSAMIILLIANILKLKFMDRDWNLLLGREIIERPDFINNPIIKEIFAIDSATLSFSTKSSIIAQHILSQTSNVNLAINAFVKIAEYSNNYTSERYVSILKNIVSASQLRHFFNKVTVQKDFILGYYDRVSRLNFYKFNHFFWLQFALACIDLNDYDRAEKYLNDALAYVPRDNFIPFQISTAQAHLYLDRIKKDKSPNIIVDLERADRILSMPAKSHLDNEKRLLRLIKYYINQEFKDVVCSSIETKNFFIECLKHACKRLEKFLYICPTFDKNEFMELMLEISKEIAFLQK